MVIAGLGATLNEEEDSIVAPELEASKTYSQLTLLGQFIADSPIRYADAPNEEICPEELSID